jgi:hypothetical protein
MALAMRVDQPAKPHGLAIWRVLVWMLLLFAALGCLQYVRHAQLVWGQLQALAPAQADAVAALRGMLAWDVGYLLAAFVLIVICAGCILRQAWARPVLRVASCLLALWALVSGGLLLAQWSSFDHASADAIAQLQSDATLQQALQHARRSYQMALVLKVVAVPMLVWLAWRLGRPEVKIQFRQRPSR